MMRKLAPAALLALALLSPAGAQMLDNQSLDKVVAIVDEDVILASELDRAVNNILAQFAGRSTQLPPRAVLENQVLERMIFIRLQVQRAESTGIRVSDPELDQAVMRIAQENNASIDQLRASLERDGFSYEDFRKTMREELQVQRLRQRYVQTRVQVTDTEVDILLASGGLKRGEVRLAHILIGVPDGAAAPQIQAAREKAERVSAEIAGGLDFASAAIRYSDGQQALEGGDLGWRRFDEVPDVFTDMITALRKGEVTQPMRGPSGFHILKMVDERAASAQIVREYNARHVMVRTSELVSSDDALAIVRSVRERLVGGEDFGALAREFSNDTTSANLGGDMGWFEVGAYGTRVAQVIESLADGDLSEPFQTEAGWHVMQRLATRETDRTDDRAREQARETIRTRKADEEYGNFLRQLRGEAFVESRLAKVEDATQSG
jgi:peptidyl-prolyl cis-trans isomerase SurA